MENTETNNTQIVVAKPTAFAEPELLRPIAPPAAFIANHTATAELIRDALEDGKDFGVIPGTEGQGGKGRPPKKVLLKPGAERLTIAFGLRAEFEIVEKEIDHNAKVPWAATKWVKCDKPSNHEELKAQGLGRSRKFDGKWVWQEKVEENGESLGVYRFVIRCKLFRGDFAYGEGVGSCSSLETKYVRNPRDAENTILKMAKKRAQVDAVLTTLGLSDRFTQDIEEQTHDAGYVDNGANDFDGPPESDLQAEERKRNAQIEAETRQKVSQYRKEIGEQMKRLGIGVDDQRKTIADINGGELPTGVAEWAAVAEELRSRPTPTKESADEKTNGEQKE